MLLVEQINCWYGDLQVLRDVSVKVEANELVVLLGLNGHGKSTLLKTVCGLVPASTGSIKFNGEEIRKMSTRKIVEMGLAYIPEEGYLFPQMTVIENLKMGAYLPLAWKNKERNFERVFQLFPRLKKREEQLVSTLSGGERQMLAIARGLMSGAKFLAMDEPSLGLAPALRLEVFKKLKEINKEGIDILLVEENIKESLKICDRAYTIEDGRITHEGKREELMADENFKKLFFLS